MPEMDHKTSAAIMIYRDESQMQFEGGLSNKELAGKLVKMNCGQFKVKAKGVTQDDSD
jgi:hypothetical protein